MALAALLMTLLILKTDVFGQEAVSYFGKQIGNFGQPSDPSYGVEGTAYAIDNKKIWLRGFRYDGNAPDAFFWAGSSDAPDQSGILIPNEVGSTQTLRVYNDENIIITLPPGSNIIELKWIAVWSQNQAMSLAHVSIPNSFDPPTVRNLGRLALSRLVHKTEADRVEILDTQTVKFYNLKYDGRGPAAYFWVGTGSSPSSSGKRVPDETGRIKVLRGYNGEDITIKFDGERTVFSYDHIGLWCELARQNFGDVSIPDRSTLNIPPSLETVEVSNTYDNCESLDDRLQVSWTIKDEVIEIQLSGRVNINDYMAFGISGSQSRTQMVGSDVTVAWFDGSLAKAKDYHLTAYSQCSNGDGACPDDEVGAVNNVNDASATILDGVTSITFTRMLNTNDVKGDQVILTSGSMQVVWAIGQINGDGLAVRHIEQGGKVLSFGRTPPTHRCSSLVGGGEINGWNELRLIGDKENTELTAVIGQSGGVQGYTSITDNVGWGISWFINDMLVPRIYLKRDVEYTFKVLGGNEPSQSATYHPFYITNDKGGGYASLTEMEKTNHVIYAGPVNGSLCELKDKNGDQSGSSTSAEDYRSTLREDCASPKEPAILKWTPTSSTPDIVYYQCYTHRFLGWQIEVVDELPSIAAYLSPAGISIFVVITGILNRLIIIY